MGMRPMGSGGPMQSPWVLTFADYVDKVLRVTVEFDDATRVITGCVAHRDSGCQYRKLLVGLGEDGTPDSTTKQFTIPVGDTVVPVSALNNRGIVNIEDLLGINITAGR